MCPRGSSVSEAVMGAAIGRLGGGRRNPPFIPLVRAASVAWHVTPGIAKWSKRRRHSLLQGVGAPRGRPVPRGERARLRRTTRSNLRGTIERMTVERTSVSDGRITLRGERRNRRPQRFGASRSRGTSRPVRAGNAEGAQPSFSRATLVRQRGARWVRGGASRFERNANLRSGLPAHGARASSDACGSRGSSLASARKGWQRANVGEEQRRPSSRSRIRRPAVGARASSVCRSR